MNDLIIYSRDFDSHLKTLKEVLECFKESQFMIASIKVELLPEKLNFLEMQLSKEGIEPSPDTNQH